MALPSKPSLSQIRLEFGDDSRPATASLRTYYIAVFGTVVSGVSAQSDFANTGKPTAVTLDPTGSNEEQLTMKGEVNPNKTPTTRRFEWELDSGIPSVDTPWDDFSAWVSVGSQSTAQEQSLTVNLSPGDYRYRIVSRNAFNNKSFADHTKGSAKFSDVVWSIPPAPTNFIIDSTSGNTANLRWTMSGGEDDCTYQARYYESGAWTITSLSQSGVTDNWGNTNTTKRGVMTYDGFFIPSGLEIQVRSVRNGQTSSWSGSDFTP